MLYQLSGREVTTVDHVRLEAMLPVLVVALAL